MNTVQLQTIVANNVYLLRKAYETIQQLADIVGDLNDRLEILEKQHPHVSFPNPSHKSTYDGIGDIRGD